MSSFWCPECADAQVKKLRAEMAAAGMGAPHQAVTLRDFKATHAGWSAERCSHRRCGPRRMPPAVEAALKGQAVGDAVKNAPSTEAGAFLERAAAFEAEARRPEHRRAAAKFAEEQAERNRREVVLDRQRRAAERDQREREAEARTRAHRARMKAKGLVEVILRPGRRCRYEDWLDYVAYKVPGLEFASVQNFGVNALRYAVEALCDRGARPNAAEYIIRQAQRVHQGFQRVWLCQADADQCPEDWAGHGQLGDAFVEFEDGPANELCPWDGGPSKGWQKKQADGEKKFSAAAKARGLHVEGMVRGLGGEDGEI